MRVVEHGVGGSSLDDSGRRPGELRGRIGIRNGQGSSDSPGSAPGRRLARQPRLVNVDGDALSFHGAAGTPGALLTDTTIVTNHDGRNSRNISIYEGTRFSLRIQNNILLVSVNWKCCCGGGFGRITFCCSRVIAISNTSGIILHPKPTCWPKLQVVKSKSHFTFDGLLDKCRPLNQLDLMWAMMQTTTSSRP